jgi:hypothetical protein
VAQLPHRWRAARRLRGLPPTDQASRARRGTAHLRSRRPGGLCAGTTIRPTGERSELCLVRHEEPGHRVPAVSPIPVMRAVPGGTGYQLLVRGELLWPGRCNAVRVRSPPGEATTCRRGVPTRRAGRARPLPLALRLTILPPGLPPTAPDAGWRPFTSEGKRAGQRGYGRDLPPDWNCPASARQRHIGSDLTLLTG